MAENVLKPVDADGPSANAEISGDWRPFEALRREIDRLFQDIETGKSLIRPPFGGPIFDFEPFSRGEASFSRGEASFSRGEASFPRGEVSWGAIPAVDVVEKEGHFEISAELPGVDPTDIEVNVNMDTLRIKGEKREETETEDQKKDFHLSERRFGAFQRTFRFPEHVVPDKIEASFSDGVLTVILPKSEETQPPGKNIPIKTK